MYVIDSAAVIEYQSKNPVFPKILKEFCKIYFKGVETPILSWLVLYASLSLYIDDYYKSKSGTFIINGQDIKDFLDANMNNYFLELIYLQKHESYSDEELFRKAYNIISWMFDPVEYKRTYEIAKKIAKIYNK